MVRTIRTKCYRPPKCAASAKDGQWYAPLRHPWEPGDDETSAAGTRGRRNFGREIPHSAALLWMTMAGYLAYR